MSLSDVVQQQVAQRVWISKWNVWKNNEWIVRQISLSLSSGAFAVLAGRNGSGKTTFLRSIAGLLRESEGWQCHGQCVIVGDSARRFAYLSQQLSPIEDIKVREFLEFSAGSSSEHWPRMHQAFGVVELYDKALTQLSGGQWQRVRLAECLSSRAGFVILDEPDVFLDVHWRRVLFKCLSARRDRGDTLLVTLHRPQEAVGSATHWLGFESGQLMFVESQPAIFPEALLSRLFL